VKFLVQRAMFAIRNATKGLINFKCAEERTKGVLVIYERKITSGRENYGCSATVGYHPNLVQV